MESTATAGPVYVFATPLVTTSTVAEIVPSASQTTSNVAPNDYNTARRSEVSSLQEGARKKNYFVFFLVF